MAGLSRLVDSETGHLWMLVKIHSDDNPGMRGWEPFWPETTGHLNCFGNAEAQRYLMSEMICYSCMKVASTVPLLVPLILTALVKASVIWDEPCKTLGPFGGIPIYGPGLTGPAPPLPTNVNGPALPPVGWAGVEVWQPLLPCGLGWA